MSALKKYISSYISQLSREKTKPGIGDLTDQYQQDNVVSLDRKFSSGDFFGDTFRSPLLQFEGEELVIKDEIDHALFLRSCELYRVLELLQRTTPTMIETYSKYRERKQFGESLEFRFFDGSEAILIKFEPAMLAKVLSLFNHIQELKIYLKYTDALPNTLAQRIGEALEIMIEDWNELTDSLQANYQWNFKKL